MIIVSREYFEITFISRKKGLCWPSVWDCFLFEFGSAQSAKRFWYPSFWNDIWLSFRNDQSVPIYILKCFMTVISRLLTFRYQVSTICWKIFYDSRFEMIYDFHFEMSNAFLFSFWNALWLSFRNEGAKFSYTKLFSSEKNQIFYWRKCIYYYYFRTQLFTQGIVSLSLRWNKFFKKGDGLLCQILIILQC